MVRCAARWVAAAAVLSLAGAGRAAEPVRRLSVGPQLFVDDYLVEKAEGVERVVNPPVKHPEPVVTGPEDKCFQPFVTVVRDEETKRFRMWYGIPAKAGENNPSRLAYIESGDGVKWDRPHRVLEDPGGIPIRFGCSVIDEGPSFADPGKRFKYGWYWGDVTDPPTGGLMVATSADGLAWTPIRPTPPVLPHTHDINNIWRDPIRQRYVATINNLVPEAGWAKKRRRTFQAFSADLVNWSEPKEVIAPDGRDEGEFQYYGMSAYLRRGDVVIGLIKVLRDDLPAEPGGEARGIGYTALAWTRDGEHWERERVPFIQRGAKAGDWDRAMTWADCQVAVGDETFIYYGGYKQGHKVERFTERQIGLARMKRDRYVAREASGGKEGRLRTPVVAIDGAGMTVNAEVAAGGALRVAVLDEGGRAIEGFAAGDCAPVAGDSTEHKVSWKRPLSELRGRPVRLEFVMREARVFAFDVRP